MAVLDPNILSVMGLRKILQDVMPVMEVVSFATLQEMLNDNPDSFVHYFVNRYLVAGRHLNQFSGVFFLLFEIYTCPFTGGAGRMP